MKPLEKMTGTHETVKIVVHPFYSPQQDNYSVEHGKRDILLPEFENEKIRQLTRSEKPVIVFTPRSQERLLKPFVRGRQNVFVVYTGEGKKKAVDPEGGWKAFIEKLRGHGVKKVYLGGRKMEWYSKSSLSPERKDIMELIETDQREKLGWSINTDTHYATRCVPRVFQELAAAGFKVKLMQRLLSPEKKPPAPGKPPSK